MLKTKGKLFSDPIRNAVTQYEGCVTDVAVQKRELPLVTSHQSRIVLPKTKAYYFILSTNFAFRAFIPFRTIDDITAQTEKV